jgi:hypothetical protein
MPGSFGHLAARFFDYLGARPLTESDRQTVRSFLSDAEARIFFEQSPRDQTHGFAAALVVLASGRKSDETIRAALLHDVGKRRAEFGVVGRVIASLLIKGGLPMTGRMRDYRDHGAIGAVDLADAGSTAIVVDFARHHHGSRPDTVDEEDWNLLQDADVPANARLARRRR